MPRTYNPNLVKVHRTYRVDEVADLYDCHRNTVRRWLAKGLEAIDDKRPLLIQGTVLRAFLNRQRACAKCPSGRGEMYCLRCHSSRKSAGNIVFWMPQSESKGCLKGCCEVCGSTINRFAKLSDLGALAAVWSIQIEGELERISDSDKPALYGDFNGGD